jgi:DNA end-binding protein Ku
VPERRRGRDDAAARARAQGAGPSEGDAAPRLRPFWSGTIAFGLVSLPVQLYSANRTSRASLRLGDEEGTPLSRRYVSSVDGRALESDEIVRGFAIDDGFVVVEDDELEALAPERSQEIDLSRFVDVAEVDPTLFERGYFLAPQRGAVKAYRLLARTMEEAGRAGIATFVMRGKEYLVAIVAEDGILRAETLRFADELRTPDAVGLPDLADAPLDERLVARLERAVDELADDHLDRSLLVDRGSRALLELVRAKLAAGEGIKEAPEEERAAVAPDESADLMELLKRSLEDDDAAASGEGPASDSEPGASGSEDLERLDKATLYAKAQEVDLPGRSRMTKDELVDALRRRPAR